MPSFNVVNNISGIKQINGYVAATKFNSKDNVVNEQGCVVGKDYKGNKYQLVSKQERKYSCLERTGRIFLGMLVFGFSLSIAWWCSKRIQHLFTKSKHTVRYALFLKDEKQETSTTNAFEQKSPKPVETTIKPTLTDSHPQQSQFQGSMDEAQVVPKEKEKQNTPPDGKIPSVSDEFYPEDKDNKDQTSPITQKAKEHIISSSSQLPNSSSFQDKKVISKKEGQTGTGIKQESKSTNSEKERDLQTINSWKSEGGDSLSFSRKYIIPMLKKYPDDNEIFLAVMDLDEKTQTLIEFSKKLSFEEGLKSLITNSNRALALIKGTVAKDSSRIKSYHYLVPDEIKEDPSFFWEAYKLIGKYLFDFNGIPKGLQKNRDFMLDLADCDWSVMWCYNENFGKDFVLEAFKRYVAARPHTEGKPQQVKDDILKAVKRNGLCLQIVDDEFKCDPEVALAAVMNDWKALEFVAKEIKAEIVAKAFQPPYSPITLRSIIRDLGDSLDSKEFILTMVKINPVFLFLTSPNLQKDTDIRFEAYKAAIEKRIFEVVVKNKEDPVSEVTSKEKQWNDWVLLCNENGGVFNAIPSTISSDSQDDRNLALRLVKSNARILDDLPIFQNDIDVVSEAVKQDMTMIAFAGNEIKENEKIVRKLIPEKNLFYVNRGDQGCVMIVRDDKNNARYSRGNLKDDKEIALKAIKFVKNFYVDLSEDLKKDEDIKLTYLRESCLDALRRGKEDLPTALQSDKGFIIEAVAYNPSILKLIDQSLWKGNKEDVTKFKVALLKANVEALKYFPNRIWEAKDLFEELNEYPKIVLGILNLLSQHVDNETQDNRNFYHILPQLGALRGIALMKDRNFLIEAVKIKHLAIVLEVADPIVWEGDQQTIEKFKKDLLAANPLTKQYL